MHRTVAVHRTRTGTGLLLVVAAALLWGTAGLVGAVVHERSGLTPLSIGFWRLAVGALATLPLLVRFRHPVRRADAGSATPDSRRRVDWPGLVGVGVALAGYQTCFFAAVDLVGVSLATLFTLGLAPVLVTIGSRVLLRETVERATIVAIGAALTGLALLVGGSSGRPGSAVTTGVGLAAASALGYAGLTLVSRRRRGRQSATTFAATSFWVGALVALPPAAWQGLSLPRDGLTALLLLYLGVGPTALAYAAFFTGLRTVPATTAAVLTLLEPAAATLLAVVLLGERLGAWAAAGGLLLLGTTVVLAVVQSRASAVTSAAASTGPIPRPHRSSA
jgi:drug/metabolite transporter, DME family